MAGNLVAVEDHCIVLERTTIVTRAQDENPHERVFYFQAQTRFHTDGSGGILSPVAYARYENWVPYLQGFDRFVLLARVSNQISTHGYSVEGPSVSVLPMPNYHGLMGILSSFFKISRFVASLPVDEGAVYGGRVADPITSMLLRKAKRNGIHCVAQVVGDPAEAMRSGSFGRLAKLLHPLVRSWVRRQVSASTGVIYVTREVLQTRYPANPTAVTVARSNVELGPADFVDTARDYSVRPVARPLELITLGAQAQRFKGHEFLIRAVAELRKQGMETHTTIIGGGRHNQHYRDLAERHHVEDIVTFTGSISERTEIRDRIRKADLFVLPSLTEGFPRALLEAMAQGIACIASDVGGNCELVERSAIFKPHSDEAIVKSVREVAGRPEILTHLAARGLDRARTVSVDQAGSRVLGEFIHRLLVSNPSSRHRTPSTSFISRAGSNP